MEHEMNDWALLRDYSEGRSEAAFAELVRRHADLVYSSALRQTGDPHLAGDVAQAVFLSLARKGATISRAAVIPGWLIHATRRESANLLRDRARRSRREQLAAEMHSSPQPNPLDAAWEGVAPLLDEGLATLRQTLDGRFTIIACTDHRDLSSHSAPTCLSLSHRSTESERVT